MACSRVDARLLGRRRKRPEGGYRTISATQICLVWSAYEAGSLTEFLDVRVYWALHEAAARRTGWRASTNGAARLGVGFRRETLAGEVQRLVGIATRSSVRASIRRLEAAGLVEIGASEIQFAEESVAILENLEMGQEAMLARIHHLPSVQRRAVPMPCRMLRLLAAERSRCVHATVLAHGMRCLWWERNLLSNVGTCTSRFVSQVFGVDRRNVKRARAMLRNAGWISSAVSPHGGRPSKDPWVAVNLDWSDARHRIKDAASEGAGAISPPVRSFAAAKSPPPIRTSTLPSGSKKYQYPNMGRVPGVRKRTEVRPRLEDVRFEDLRTPQRLHVLFRQAVTEKQLRDCEGDGLRFAAAAVHALRIGKQNPCGLFATVVRRRLWGYASQADEDEARVLMRHPAWQAAAHAAARSGTEEADSGTVKSDGAIGKRIDLVDGLVRELSIRWSVDSRRSDAQCFRQGRP